MKKSFVFLFSTLFLAALVLPGCGTQNTKTDAQGNPVVRVGYFANMTHAQALVGLSENQRTFQNALGQDTTIETAVFNAGPQEIEALFAGQIDIGYIGPSPAVNGYIKSQGEALRIISGATANGVALVLQPEVASAFKEQGAAALEGRKIASPQQGNTQDVALRSYLAEHSLTEKTEVVPIANADQLTLFSQKELDGSWAPEPWASRLAQEAGGEIVLNESELWPQEEFATAIVIVRKEFLDEHPDIVKRWLEAHVATTEWMKAYPQEAQVLLNAEIEKLTGKKLADEVLTQAWARMQVTNDPLEDTIRTAAHDAYTLGFLETEPDLSQLFDLTLLNEVTTQQGQ